MCPCQCPYIWYQAGASLKFLLRLLPLLDRRRSIRHSMPRARAHARCVEAESLRDNLII